MQFPDYFVLSNIITEEIGVFYLGLQIDFPLLKTLIKPWVS